MVKVCQQVTDSLVGREVCQQVGQQLVKEALSDDTNLDSTTLGKGKKRKSSLPITPDAWEGQVPTNPEERELTPRQSVKSFHHIVAMDEKAEEDGRSSEDEAGGRPPAVEEQGAPEVVNRGSF